MTCMPGKMTTFRSDYNRKGVITVDTLTSCSYKILRERGITTIPTLKSGGYKDLVVNEIMLIFAV